ncbi:oxidoreductase [Massilia sp. W12]|uniref:oxidoreductase n=1 Tax=Massilia sp. W12 TaxID=3126507 RepID=UPI0030CC364F
MHTLTAPIRVGLIGYGLAGATFHAPLLQALPVYRLTAVASSQAELLASRLPQARVVTAPEALFDDAQIDLIVIAAPNQQHFPLAQAALRAGKHVVVDKPFTLSSTEARSLIGLAQQRGLQLSVFHNRRWDGDFLALKDLLAQQSLGELNTFVSRIDRFRPQVRARWREQDAAGGGLLFDLAPHLLDQALQLFGQPHALYADLAQQRSGAQGVDYFQLHLYYRQYPALRVQLGASCLTAAAGPRFLLHGMRGSWCKYGMDGQEDALRAGLQPLSAGWHVAQERATLYDESGVAHEIALKPGNWCEFYAALAPALLTGGAPPVSAEDALQGILLLEAAQRSAASGQRLIVDGEEGCS